jgi:hypothetical protein
VAHDDVNFANGAREKLIDDMGDDRFAAEGQQQFLNAHPARQAGAKNYGANHGCSFFFDVL